MHLSEGRSCEIVHAKSPCWGGTLEPENVREGCFSNIKMVTFNLLVINQIKSHKFKLYCDFDMHTTVM